MCEKKKSFFSFMFVNFLSSLRLLTFLFIYTEDTSPSLSTTTFFGPPRNSYLLSLFPFISYFFLYFLFPSLIYFLKLFANANKVMLRSTFLSFHSRVLLLRPSKTKKISKKRRKKRVSSHSQIIVSLLRIPQTPQIYKYSQIGEE
ncbi:hypothetical protein, unlikely [Trypanosoma brucei gambiense DAL972]|uniref:Uncharacterized protein n=1 Tax=Trypanosoma brucei gambiense (strain MHOM/CI/86/DAL972) TaxID=679716 RepID=D0A310_TRYB9|nr:hypothetical protein, unlikely [Trypanosoma brucei gambiense DAL972]CBH15654.1 hypothetical protein, unlikely [Trypanosoma brucei gambiense DAL972]|eukprot:XP_011777918.1 hypothetical protein, unlikely [Trypanosoma brucei gambiense DAL972]